MVGSIDRSAEGCGAYLPWCLVVCAGWELRRVGEGDGLLCCSTAQPSAIDRPARRATDPAVPAAPVWMGCMERVVLGSIDRIEGACMPAREGMCIMHFEIIAEKSGRAARERCRMADGGALSVSVDASVWFCSKQEANCILVERPEQGDRPPMGSNLPRVVMAIDFCDR